MCVLLLLWLGVHYMSTILCTIHSLLLKLTSCSSYFWDFGGSIEFFHSFTVIHHHPKPWSNKSIIVDILAKINSHMLSFYSWLFLCLSQMLCVIVPVFLCNVCDGQIQYKDSLGQGTAIPDLPEVKRVRETQKNISLVEEQNHNHPFICITSLLSFPETPPPPWRS